MTPQEIQGLLRKIIPFRALSPQQIRDLAKDLTERQYAAGDVIVRQADVNDKRVFLLVQGLVETVDPRREPPVRINTILAEHYFGDQSALFDCPREGDARAVEPCRVLEMSSERFLGLLRESNTFAQALGGILRVKQKVFHSIDDFLAELFYGVSLGTISLFRLIPVYRRLEPALHPKANDPVEIDFGAWLYAVRRLPDNITRTLMLFLTDDLPSLYGQPQKTFRAVATAVRPRSTYEMLPGKNMVLLRDGLSDLIDIITCICLYSVEARKLRKRISQAEHLEAIGKFLEETNSNVAERPEQEREFLRTLPLSERETEGLLTIWPTEPVARLREILVQHEDFGIGIRKQLNNYNSRPAEAWANQLAEDVSELLGRDLFDLPPDFSIHIISSNTHSVTNCLSHYMAQNREVIEAWGLQHRPNLMQMSWGNRLDLLYVLARDYLNNHPTEKQRKRDEERETGVLRRYETAFTGIQVELIDVGRIGTLPIDSSITPPPVGAKALIVNIDFAFGQQAEEIIAGLIMLFSRNLASINVLGKAGTLVGRRGDLLVPTAFIEQQSDQFHPLPRMRTINVDRLNRMIPGRSVHTGPMLTVQGTLMQNRMLLNFYKRVWKCVGLEMEGYYYHRHVQEAMQRGVIDSRIPVRFLYYVSDAPLDSNATLSESLSVLEGVPPLYAITREILNDIFEQEARRA